MLTKEEINKNYENYINICKKYGVINDSLIEELGVSFIKAPCTTNKSAFGAYDGALIEYLIKCTNNIVKLNKSLGNVLDNDLVIKTALIHGIGKYNMFIPNDSDWHVNRGEIYKFNPEYNGLQFSTNSIVLLYKHGIELKEDIIYAISNYNSEFVNKPNNKTSFKLAALLKIAIDVTIFEMKYKN